jgi:peptidoglycan/xylan/chitin deacetylase (PgdA/CDA1 family)
VTSLKHVLVRILTVLLLPISLLPIYFALPRLKAEFSHAIKEPARNALASVNVAFSPQEKARWTRFPDYHDSIPVLTYHGINDRNDVYSVSRHSFSAQVEMLDGAGFESVSMEQYVRFLNGDSEGLPEKPVLITFDDGRLDSYRGADQVLARHGFRATMFVIASAAEADDNFYLNWNELNQMAESGRWELQEHAGAGHHNVRHDRNGRSGPFYAYRQMVGHQLESFADYKQRVTQDVLEGKRLMAKHLPSFRPLSFAVPYGNYGQQETNDRRIPGFFDGFLRQHFKAVFIVNPAGFTTKDTPRGRIGRYEVRTYTTAGRLFNWLRNGVPGRDGQELLANWCRPGWTCQPKPRGGGSSHKRSSQGSIPVSQQQPVTGAPQFVSAQPRSQPQRVSDVPRSQPQSAPSKPSKPRRKRITVPKPEPVPVAPSAPLDALEELPSVP